MRKIFSLIAAVLFAGSMMADKYVKVTSAPADWAGQYLIVYEGDNTHAAVAFNGGLTTLDAVENGVAVTIANGEITGSEALTAAEFTIAAVEGGYSIQAANGKYIGATAYANSLVASDEAIVNNLDALVPAVVLTGGTVTMKYNYAANQLRFRYYKTGQQDVALYKLEAGEAPAVAAPVIAGEETFEESVEVSISCATEGAAILYTTDDAAALNAFVAYTDAFSLTESATVRAYAVLGEDTSAVVSKTFTKVEPAQAITCADVYGMAKNDEVGLLNPVTVTFANGKNVWVKDETASMLIYFSANTNYVAGDVLSGIAGTVDIYNGVTEVKPSAAQAAAIEATAGVAPEAEVVASVATTDVNKYIVMQGIEFEADTAFVEDTQKNIVINGVTVRNQFKNGYAFEANSHYDIYGVVTIYQNNPQVYFITAVQVDPTAIDNTNADAKVVKFFENGQLLINKNGVIYNAQGAIVK